MASLIIKTELADFFAKQQEGLEQIVVVSDILKKAVLLANETVEQTAHDNADCEGMGTTLVCCFFADNKIVVGHIGDSRVYRLRQGNFVQLTEDHSLLQSQINAGLITEAEARFASNRHMITRALGTCVEVELDLSEHAIQVGDLYLLCSDGLTDLVEDDEVKSTIISANGDMTLALKQLLTLANAYGGNDNISMLIASVEKPFPME